MERESGKEKERESGPKPRARGGGVEPPRPPQAPPSIQKIIEEGGLRFVKEMEVEMDSRMHHQSELSILHEEIMSLVSERQNLLASLTPNLFVWEDESATARRPALNSQQQQQVRDEEESASTWRIAGKFSAQKMDSSPIEPAAAAAGSRPNWQQDKLEDYLDSILQDMEDLGHRMLSMQDNRELDAPISLYKKTELFATTSRLVNISKDLSGNTNVDVVAQEVAEMEALASHAFASFEREKEGFFARHARREVFARDARGEVFARDARGEVFARDAWGEMFARDAREVFARDARGEVFARDARGEVFARDARGEAYAEHTLSVEDNRALSNEFLHLCSNYLKRPNTYTKHLSLIITKEEKEELEEKEKEREKQKQKEEKEKDNEKGKKTREKEEDEDEEDYDGVFEEETESKEYLIKRMVLEQGFFSNHRVGWEHIWGSKIGRCGYVKDTTTLSPMHFTHCAPGIIPHGSVVGTTLQIYYFKIELKADLKWPLRVYGVVAARDTVDRNRNLLFCRSRVNYQLLTRDDPFLRLTGPSRAILALYPVNFEVQLKIIDQDESQDRALISCSLPYYGEVIALFHSSLCTGKLRLEPIGRTVQATIVGVRLSEGDWPFKYGARVSCDRIMLLDSRDEEVTVASDGYLPLSRNVISVELNKALRVTIEAYPESGRSSAAGHVLIDPPKHCNIVQAVCSVGNCWVEITVAWSRLVQDKMDLMTEGYAAQA